MESSGCAGLPLTMTMLSLWPWHHSRLWIINRGLDPNADGLFVGKQGVISLSRQSDLMARHKYIKGGIAVISSDPNFGPSRRAIVGTFGLSGPRSPVKSCCSAAQVCGIVRTSIHSSWGVRVWRVRYDFWRLTLTPSVSPAWIHNVHTPRGSENTTSATLEPLKVRPFSCFCGVGQQRLKKKKDFNFWNNQVLWVNTHKINI